MWWCGDQPQEPVAREPLEKGGGDGGRRGKEAQVAMGKTGGGRRTYAEGSLGHSTPALSSQGEKKRILRGGEH